jgi:choline monooxygenase
MAGIQNFEREDMSLVALRAEVWGPWVFVNADPDARPLSEQLGELTARLDRGGWDKLHFVDRRTWTLACNWKVYVDNYLDGGYHIPHMHPSLDAQLDMSSYRTDVFERFSIQTSGSAGGSHERIGEQAIYAWIYPNFMLNRYGPCLDTNYVMPLGHDRCQVLYEFYFLETEGEPARRFIEQSIEQAGVTQREDIAICESVQIGLGSSSYDRGRYAPRVETGEHHFHCLLASDLRRELAPG